MDLWQALALALLQGLTEFLPISSSAHLILVPVLTGWQDQGLAFDVMVHVGTLAAVICYFRIELKVMIREWFASLGGRGPLTPDARLTWAVLLGTIPAALAGLLAKDFIGQYLRTPLVIAGATIVFGLLLWWADRRGRRSRDEHTITWADVLFVGLSQALALIPGVSRSGITITAALLVGFNRQAAARYSFLLSIPIIALAGGWEAVGLLRASVPVASWTPLLVGALASGLAAYACIHFFLKLLARISMLPFVLYRLALGVVLLIFVR